MLSRRSRMFVCLISERRRRFSCRQRQPSTCWEKDWKQWLVGQGASEKRP